MNFRFRKRESGLRPAHADNSQSHQKSKHRVLRGILFSLAGLIAVVGGLVAWLGYTENGARWLLARVSAMQPGLIQVEALHGYLLGALKVRGVRLNLAESRVNVDEIELRWSAAKLLSRQVYVDALTVSGVRVLLPAATAQPPSAPPAAAPSLPPWPTSLPLDVTLHDLNVVDVYVAQIATPSEPLFEAHRLHAAARLDQDGIRLERLELDAPAATVRAKATVNATADYAVDAEATVQGRLAYYLPHYPDVDTRLRVTGTVADLLVAITLQAPTTATLTGQIKGLPDFSTTAWNARLLVDDTSLQTWNIDFPALAFTGAIDANGTAAAPVRAQPAMRVRLDNIDYNIHGDLNWNGTEVRTQSLTVSAPAAGTSLQAQGVVAPLATPLTFDAAVEWNKFRWPLSGPLLVTSANGSGRINGNLDAFTLAVDGDLATDQTAPLRINASALGSKEGLKRLHADARAAKAHIQLDGDVQWTPELSIAASAQWRQLQSLLRKPPPAAAGVVIPTGNIHIGGTLERFAVAMDTDVASTQAGVANVSIGGTGSTQGLDVVRLSGAALSGSVIGSGKLDWASGFKWTMQMQGRGINVAQLGGLPSSKLAFEVTSRGTKPAGKGALVMHAELPTLSGTFNDLPVKARAGFDLNGDSVQIDDLRAALGPTQLSASGIWGPKSDLEWRLDAPDLHGIDSRLQGAIRADGTLRGAPKTLHVTIDTVANGLRFGTFEAASASLSADVNTDPKLTVPSHIRAELRGVSAATERYDVVSLQATGTAQAHEALLAVGGRTRSGSLTTHGGWDGEKWQGELDNLILEPSSGQIWRSEGAVPITLSVQDTRLEPLCIAFLKNRFCIEGATNARGRYARIDVPSLDLDVLQPWLPTNLALRGGLQAQANITATPDGKPVGYATLTLPAAQMSRDADALPAAQINITGTSLDARIDPEQFTLNIQSDVDKIGAVRAAAKVGGKAFPAQWAVSDVTGSLKVSVNDLTQFGPFIPNIKDIGGRANIDLTANGQLSNPQVELNAVLDNGHVHVIPANLRVGDIALALRGATERGFEIRGDARSGDGALALRGYAVQDGAEWTLTSSLRGDRVTAMDTRQVRVLISPDIDFFARPEGMLVRGLVHIPVATIRSPQVKGAKQRSKDVEIIEEGPIQIRALPLTLDIQVTLGDQINVEASGLRAGLGGDVRIRKAQNEDLNGSGELRIESGLFEAFGQALVIERGRLIYAGSPLEDPGLDLRATRKFGETTVGAQVSGRASAPSVTVFSDPPMNQTEALSYLLLGRSLNGASASETKNAEGMSAAASMGMEIAARELGRRLGFEDISIVQDDKGSSTVIIGRYLTPRLYVGYGADILEQISSLHVNYKLSSKWTLQTETSAASSGADLVFTLDSE